VKKFKFSLDKVLEFNRHIQKKETDILAVLHAEYDELVAKKMSLINEYEHAKQEYYEHAASGIKVIDIVMILNHIEDIQKLIKDQNIKISEKNLQVEKQSVKLISVTQDKKTVEKLRDNKLEIYKSEQRKNDEKFIEEFLSNRNSLII
jgi:Flagellar FliJ protein.